MLVFWIIGGVATLCLLIILAHWPSSLAAVSVGFIIIAGMLLGGSIRPSGIHEPLPTPSPSASVSTQSP